MTKTEHLKLDLMEGTDAVVNIPAVLNANAEAVDAAVDSLGDFAMDGLGELAGEIDALTAALGSGGHTARIAWGSYQGTGQYGAGNPNTLTFDFTPVAVLTGGLTSASSGTWPTVMLRDCAKAHRDGGSEAMYVTWGDHAVSWYADQHPNYQNNNSNTLYYYVAFGYSG